MISTHPFMATSALVLVSGINGLGQSPLTISSVTPAWGQINAISQNTWIEIKGVLTPTTTPAGGVFWNNAPELTMGVMPTQLAGVSVTINGKPAYISWYCSSLTTLACNQDQINALTPLDSTTGTVNVVVTSSGASSQPFAVTMNTVSPQFLLLSTDGEIAAEHTDYTIVGSLGTFAKPGEIISLFGTGFGLPTTQITAGSVKQYGPLPALPTCTMSGISSHPLAANVIGAYLISPGLYQVNIMVPAQAPNGLNQVYCKYQGAGNDGDGPYGAYIEVTSPF